MLLRKGIRDTVIFYTTVNNTCGWKCNITFMEQAKQRWVSKTIVSELSTNQQHTNRYTQQNSPNVLGT